MAAEFRLSGSLKDVIGGKELYSVESGRELRADIDEVKQREEIEAYTPVVIYPSLVVNESLVCIGCFPRKDEITGWLRQALEKTI